MSTFKIRQFYDLIVIYFEPVPILRGSGLITSLTPCYRCVRRMQIKAMRLNHFFFFSICTSFYCVCYFSVCVSVLCVFLECTQYRFTRNKQLLLTISINVSSRMSTYLLLRNRIRIKADEEKLERI